MVIEMQAAVFMLSIALVICVFVIIHLAFKGSDGRIDALELLDDNDAALQVEEESSDCCDEDSCTSFSPMRSYKGGKMVQLIDGSWLPLDLEENQQLKAQIAALEKKHGEWEAKANKEIAGLNQTLSETQKELSEAKLKVAELACFPTFRKGDLVRIKGTDKQYIVHSGIDENQNVACLLAVDPVLCMHGGSVMLEVLIPHSALEHAPQPLKPFEPIFTSGFAAAQDLVQDAMYSSKSAKKSKAARA